MNFALALLKAKSIGVGNFRDNLCRYIQKAKTYIITEHGEPTSVVMPYEEVMELLDILDELQDRDVLKLVAEGRKSIKKGARGISASKVFKKA